MVSAYPPPQRSAHCAASRAGSMVSCPASMTRDIQEILNQAVHPLGRALDNLTPASEIAVRGPGRDA